MCVARERKLRIIDIFDKLMQSKNSYYGLALNS